MVSGAKPILAADAVCEIAGRQWLERSLVSFGPAWFVEESKGCLLKGRAWRQMRLRSFEIDAACIAIANQDSARSSKAL